MARKVNKNSVRNTQTKRRREEARKQQEQLRNRIIAGVAGILLIAVIVVFVISLRGTVEEGDETGEESGTSSDTAGEGTLIEGDRPLAKLAPPTREGFFDAYPEMIIDTSKSYQAVFRTEKGDMVVQLFDDESPLTVNNFVFLVTQGFYDNTIFHRVIPDFMAQGGDPTGSGTGGPGYSFADEVDNGLAFDKPHLLAMANAGPGTNGSQFFITFVETPHLNGNHTIFGELIEGEDVLNSITFVQPGNLANQGPAGDVIIRIDIYESEG